ncbi:MAG TPA: peptidoglycan DD-metalloendopeptidase family protein [Gemmatimonadales bacterium]|nr:peptidoglycan DD-metalloendopeptidase family protein [Gemmatimonadales bacterium]
MMRRFPSLSLLCTLVAGVPALAQTPARAPLPPLPDTTGWGVHVLAVARDPRGSVWVGTYGRGIYRLRPGATTWESIRHDTTSGSIAWDFVHAFAFGPRGEVWYGTVGNGWGVSLDDGATWRNWTFDQLGPEWQYVAPNGIATRGDTTWVATADGLQVTTDNGASWTALVDSTGPAARGPADTAYAVLPNEYVRRLALDPRGVLVATPKGNRRLARTPDGWVGQPASGIFAPLSSLLVDGRLLRGTRCGLRFAADTAPCFGARARALPAEPPRPPLTTWFRRPIDLRDNPYIDQTYRYGSTMGGNFQQHQGVEFNNADGTPVLAIGAGEVVYAGRAEAGALTVAIRHDSALATPRARLHVFSVYYHNASLAVRVGDRVTPGQVIARVGSTGRATNDHLHLEVHASPTDSVGAIVDSLQRFPPYTTNPELWIEPLPGTGLVAGQVLDAEGRPVPGARIYGLVKPEPAETPFSFAETYADRAHPHPLYQEHFAVGDVPPGNYLLGTEIAGRRVYRRVTVEPGKVSWVVFRPDGR